MIISNINNINSSPYTRKENKQSVSFGSKLNIRSKLKSVKDNLKSERLIYGFIQEGYNLRTAINNFNFNDLPSYLFIKCLVDATKVFCRSNIIILEQNTANLPKKSLRDVYKTVSEELRDQEMFNIFRPFIALGNIAGDGITKLATKLKKPK